MNKTRPKKERATANGAPIKVKLQSGLYEVLRLLQAPILAAFWAIEKRLNRLHEQLYREGAIR
jgi:hypothetical protein